MKEGFYSKSFNFPIVNLMKITKWCAFRSLGNNFHDLDKILKLRGFKHGVYLEKKITACLPDFCFSLVGPNENTEIFKIDIL